MAAEVGREDDDGGPFAIAEYGHQSPGGTYSSEETEEMMIRHMQLARGSVSTKMVASKLTLRSLQSVKLEELPEADLSENFLAGKRRQMLTIFRLCHLLQ
jgi:hypothetical protein